MKTVFLFFLTFFSYSIVYAQNLQYVNYNIQPLKLADNWAEYRKDFPLITSDSLTSLSSIELYGKGYKIEDKAILEQLDKVEIMGCKQSSLASTLVFRDEILGEHVERHKVWATRLNYSPNFEATIISIEYAERSGCSEYPRVFLLNTRGNEVTSVVRIAAASSSRDEYTKLEAGKIFKHRDAPNMDDVIIDDDYLKQQKSAGRWLDHIVYLNWFRISNLGKVELMKKERL